MMMERRTLYHFPLCPFCRKVRLMLFEKGIPHALVNETPWDRRPEFLKLNPIGDLPVLVEADGTVMTGHNAICEYLNEISAGINLMAETPKGRAEIRRLVGWFDGPFYMDVLKPLMSERVLKALKGQGTPNSLMIRNARENLKRYFKYIDWLAARRAFLGGKNLSLADLTIAAHVSVLDYLGEIIWGNFPEMKTWYLQIKSRQSFNSLLQDNLAGIMPSETYTHLDF